MPRSSVTKKPPRSLVLLLLAIPVLLVALVVAAFFNTTLSTRVLTSKATKVANLKTLQSGAKVIVEWNKPVKNGTTSVLSNRTLYPKTKIELVTIDKAGKTKFYTLLARTANDGSETVTIPKLPTTVQKASFRITGIDSKGKPTSARTDLAALPVVAAPVEVTDSGGGGGSSSGSSGGGQSNVVETDPVKPHIKIHEVCLGASTEAIVLKYEQVGGWSSYSPVPQFRLQGTTEWISPSDSVGYRSYNHEQNYFNYIWESGHSQKTYEMKFNIDPNFSYTFSTGPAVTPAESQQYNVNNCDFRKLSFTTNRL